MDAVTHFDLKRPLFRFSGSDCLFVSNAFAKARAGLIDSVLGCEFPVVLTGTAGVGKTVLLNNIAQQFRADGIRVLMLSDPALVDLSSFGNPDVAMVDEAGGADASHITAIVDAARRQGTTLVLAAINTRKLPEAARTVRMRPMTATESADFLIDAAVRAGRPDLFSAAAQDAIIAAAHGIPRALKLLGNGAVIEALFEGAGTVSAKHVAKAIDATPPLPLSDAADGEHDDAVVACRHEAGQKPLTMACLAASGPAPVAGSEDSGADADSIFIPFQPMAAAREGFQLGSHGLVAGIAALAFLIAAAAAYAVGTLGIDRIADLANLPAPSGRRLAAPQSAPPLSTPTAGAVPDYPPAIAPMPVPVPLRDDRTREGVAAGQVAAMIEPAAPEATGPSVAWPPLPTPGTPGYRPPTPVMPTLSAAARAGIPTSDGAPPGRAETLPSTPLSLDVTEPIDGSAGRLSIAADRPE